MSDHERRAKCAKILIDSGWKRRKDESSRMIKMFEENACPQAPSTGDILMDVTTDPDLRFPPFFPLARYYPEDSPSPDNKTHLTIVYRSNKKEDSTESAA